MLQTIRIDKENREFFQSYFPSGIAGKLTRRNVMLIGAAEDQTAIGAMAVETEKETATILWLFVTTVNRRRGVATMLLHDLSDACRKEHFREINAAFSEDDGAPALTALLEKGGFSCSPLESAGIETCGLFDVNLEVLSPFRTARVFPLAEVSDYSLKLYGSGLPDTMKPMAELPLLKTGYDPCSTAIVENGVVTGVCLMKQINEANLQLCLFHTQKSPSGLAAMLATSVETARKTYPPGTRLSMLSTDETTVRLFRKLDSNAIKVQVYEARKVLERGV